MVWCVTDREAVQCTTTSGLCTRGPAREPELRSTRVELDQAHRVIKGKSDQQNQEILLQLADLENELREETSLTSFITGFPLGMGITGEIEPF